MIYLPTNNISNSKFADVITKNLGGYWSVKIENGHYVLDSEKKLQYFIPEKSVSISDSTIWETLKEQIQKYEFSQDHYKFVTATQSKKIEHTKFESFGIAAEMYCDRTMTYFDDFHSSNPSSKGSFEKLKEMTGMDELLFIRKNIFPYFAVLSLFKYSYLILDCKPSEVVKIAPDAFRGVIPDPYDFGSYLDPFLIFSPVFISIPIERPTSKSLLIPKKSFLIPYEGSAGLQQIVTSSSNSKFRFESFQIFGKENSLSKIFIRRYIEHLVNTLNEFISFLTSPSSFLRDGKTDPRLAIQAFSTAHFAFQSFSNISTDINYDRRLIHSFNLVDRLSNYCCYIGDYLDPSLKLTKKEPEVFKLLYEKEVFKEILNISLKKMSDQKIAGEIKTAGLNSSEQLIESLSKFPIPPTTVIRELRNLNHGGFLRNERFLKTFSSSDCTLSSAIIPYCYFLMLSFVSSPNEFVNIIVNKVKG